MLLQRRRLFRWRMSIIVLMFLSMICSSELAAINVPQSSSVSSDRRKSSDIGTFNDFEWQTWLVNTRTGSHELEMDSATILRKITPKSVFVAPNRKLTNCSEGYYADEMGRCVKNVNVNEDAHRGFLVQQLAHYGVIKKETPVEKNNNNWSNGPLQLNIPLTPVSKFLNSTKVEEKPEETVLKDDPIVLPLSGEIRPDDEKRRQTQEESASELKKDTTLNEEEALFFRRNSSVSNAGKVDQKLDLMIPELIKEPNNTNLSKTEDYKILLDTRTMLNILNVKRLNASNVAEKDVPAEKRRNSTHQAPSALVLLLSSTNLPDSNDPSLTQNDTSGHTAQSNVTSNVIAKESGDVSIISTVPSTQESTEVAPIAVDEHRDNETHSEDELKVLENPKLNESQEIEILYDEEGEDVDYPYVTNKPDEDESIEMEGEEILKHGEAGITIPTRNVERVKQNRTANRNKTFNILDQIMIRFNDTTLSTDDEDEADSNVSSEVSIDGDRILETTLLNVNTERLQTTTKLPEMIQQNVKNAENDSEELFDQRLSSETAVVLSETTHDTMSGNGRERIEHTASVEDERNEELEAAPTSSESLLYELPEENPVTRISEEKSSVKKNVVRENPKNTESSVSLIDLGQTTMNLDSAEDYVKFPDNVKQPQQDGYVRFPSNEANSIHSSTYKQQSPVDDRSTYGSTSTKSSVPVHQKPVYYLTRVSWPDQLRDHVPTTRRRRPELLRFWSNMPLIRDPAIYPVDQVPNDEATDDRVQH